jgi:DNA mismatch repair protein MutL
MPIRQLAPDVAAKIAAGEVVERPASVVKEVIENSIDAGATQIRVDLANGGLQLIRVTDNGSGIPPEELPLALERHATSKVAQIDDLERIRSLGFRGEALASIAAVAEVNLVSRPRTAEQAAQISASNGQLSTISPAASPEGTVLTVRNLFSAVPARLKFLKSRNTEVSHCHHLLEQYALAYPEIRFSVYSEGRQIFATPGDGQLSSVLVEVYGLQIAEQMVPIQSPQSDDGSRPVVNGHVSRPVSYKSTRQYISFFVNRRWVLSRVLTAAVEDAYHSLLLPGRHPIAVVNIEVDPGLLDVNVHPAKTEIRFLKERLVYATIQRAVRAALLEESQMPQWQSRQSPKSQAQEASTVPQENRQASTNKEVSEDDPLAGLDELDSVDDANGDDLPFVISSQGTQHAQETEPVPTYPRDSPWVTVTEEETGTRPPGLSRLWQSHVRGNLAGNQEPDPVARSQVEQSPQVEPALLPVPPVSEEKKPVDVSVIVVEQDVHIEAIKRDVTQNEEVWTGTRIDPGQSRKLPRLRVVGQVAQSFIVTEGADGMYLVDQHAAHERILLERMVAALKARAPLSQLLLTPIALDLSPTEFEAFEEHLPQLEQIGFSLAATDTPHTLEIQAVPSVLVKQMNAHSLHELLLDLTSPESLGQAETWEERALANVACKAAIKANYFLTISEMREMLEQLEQTNAPFSCCHGRPTMVHFSLSALEREFGRR